MRCLLARPVVPLSGFKRGLKSIAGVGVRGSCVGAGPLFGCTGIEGRITCGVLCHMVWCAAGV